MLERRGGLDLLDEPLGAEHGGELGLQDLDRDLAVVLEVLGQVDRGHPALAELALDPVAVGEGRGEASRNWRHAHLPSRIGRSSVNQFRTSTSRLAAELAGIRPKKKVRPSRAMP